MRHLRLERREQALSWSIVPAVGFVAHAAFDGVMREHSLEVPAGELHDPSVPPS